MLMSINCIHLENTSVTGLKLMSIHFQSMGKDECQPIDAYVNTFAVNRKR
jgi:hypothetical protein